MGKLQDTIAITVAKAVATASRLSGRGAGTTLPGRMALKLSPGVLQRLGASVNGPRVAITGTNGKTTTAGVLSAMLAADGQRVVHNRLGANMLGGIASALVLASRGGRLPADALVLEVDEASLRHVAKHIRLSHVLVTNLFRDQLDRYGELDTTARMIAEGLGPETELLYNADDPTVISLAEQTPRQLGFSLRLAEPESGHPPATNPLGVHVPFPAEVATCPVCHHAMAYTGRTYAHLGQFTCPGCGYHPKPGVIGQLKSTSLAGSQLTIAFPTGQALSLNVPLPGSFNAGNVLAASVAAQQAGVAHSAMQAGLAAYHGVFGRGAQPRTASAANGQPVALRTLLIKNPVGAGEALHLAAAHPELPLLIALNDLDADGRDVSWIWDADFECLWQHRAPIGISGRRSQDMALRMRYAGVPIEHLRHLPDDIQSAVNQALAWPEAQAHGLMLVPTYTNLLALRPWLEALPEASEGHAHSHPASRDDHHAPAGV